MASTRLLVKVRGDVTQFANGGKKSFGAKDDAPRVILRLPPGQGAGPMGMAGDSGAAWLSVDVGARATPWDAAHALVAPGTRFAAGSSGVEFVEPDIEQQWLPDEPASGMQRFAASSPCAFTNQDDRGGKETGPGVGWNHAAAYSAFDAALDRFGDTLAAKLGRVTIAHLDTGYDPGHITKPLGLDTDLQRNFVEGGPPGSAVDTIPDGASLSNRGHGTATLALLAGGPPDRTAPDWQGYARPIGGAPFARVIPIRIADWVVRFTTGTMVQGFNHAIESGAHVLSMSMGGLSSAALTDAVNRAYDEGMVLVAAAGNNFAGRPTPKSVVFPARYRRVLAACGVMAKGRAYAGLHDGIMQGNYGPESKMATALGAFTPNVPWAVIGCSKLVAMDGAGTSSATPQIAAAAALWLAENFDEVMALKEPWMRVEAVRNALFASAAKSTAAMDAAETLEKIGQGVLKADAALSVSFARAAAKLTRLPPAEASWSWINLIFGGGVSIAPGAPGGREAMFALELTQMAQRVASVDAAIGDCDLPGNRISPAACRRYLEAALDEGNPSQALKAKLEQMLARAQSTPVRAPLATAPAVKRKPKEPPPPRRRLRTYALDPSVAKSLSSVAVNEAVLSVPWEEPLHPGPVGEYLEVVDVDPASNRFYDPVDLNEPKLLAQDGWPPSEGNPQFHQQMVYAVAMNTIGHFEEALGRKALWAPRRTRSPEGGPGDSYAVPRLRIYPHALRTDNAYYSPEKVALLFGYFPAASRPGDVTAPGSMVFSCLSSDIVAHEMSHALLDGLHGRLQEASNPDVPAFHEAFADIVALFQHFAIPELVRFQVAQAHGRLSAARLLGGLAKQFGEGTRRGGPLRDYLAGEVPKLSYASTTDVHARGSILVYAVYQAFLKIVDHRTADLIRIATGGTGVLPEGALHPDLVGRLTEEACKTARHVLRMCIRALDYCPAVDITFGEYLRALITADRDLVPEDRFHYRVAFLEAFRASDILPRDVRTVSEETLAWSTMTEPSPPWLEAVFTGLELGWDRVHDRSTLYASIESNRWAVWMRLKKVLAEDPALCAAFGLKRDVPRFGDDGKPRKSADGATTFEVFSIRPARRVAPDGSFRTEVIATIQQRQALPVNPAKPDGAWFWFRGGATLIIDPREGHREVRYCIVKNSDSRSRQDRQRQTVSGGILSPLRSLYFGNAPGEPFAMLHADTGAF
ncbi:S8 family serine peptidase [Azospirillum sp. HJ39]|uniref:S8 family serine peptidase n=1 Tax=Azospirillum sp. HJ39 TaxID=3159496 RepID=UPI00355704EE